MEYLPPSCRVSQPFPKRLCLNYFSLFRLWSCKIPAYGLKLNVPPLFHLDNLQNSPAAQGSQTMRPSGHGAGLSRWDEVAQVFSVFFLPPPLNGSKWGFLKMEDPQVTMVPVWIGSVQISVNPLVLKQGFVWGCLMWIGDGFFSFQLDIQVSILRAMISLPFLADFPAVFHDPLVREQCQQPWSTLLILLRTSSTGLFAAIPIMNCNDFCSKV